MNINIRNTAVHLLMDTAPINFVYLEEAQEVEEFLRQAADELLQRRPAFRKRIHYLCPSFTDVFFKERGKLIRNLKEASVQACGTFIHPQDSEGVLTSTIFYELDIRIAGGSWMVNGRMISFVNRKDFKDPIFSWFADMQNNSTEFIRGMKFRLNDSDCQAELNFVISMALFIQICKVKTKVVEAGQELVQGKEKYWNDTALPVEVLDTTWFTTIYRSKE